MEAIKGRVYINLTERPGISATERKAAQNMAEVLHKRGYEVHHGPQYRGPQPAPFLRVLSPDDSEILRSSGLQEALAYLERL